VYEGDRLKLVNMSGPTVSFVILLVPLALAVTVATVVVVTGWVVTLKLAVLAPSATVTDGGTETSVELLARVTARPPAGAAAVKVTVPVTAPCPPTTEELPRVTVLTVIGTTVTFADFVTVPYVPETVTVLEVVTPVVATENVAVVEPAATVTDVGTRTRVVFTDFSAMVMPPSGAGPVSRTVPVPARLPVMVVGETVRELNVTGVRVSVAERDEPLR
jgi:hypothetical protein